MKLLTRCGESSAFFLLPVALSTLTFVSAQADSKRGVSVLDSHNSDWSLLTSAESPLRWYWNWSPWPAPSSLVSDLVFVPQIHGITNIEADIAQVKTIPANSTHLMTFNEPDGTTSSGGSSISPDDAAKAYIEYILPLRKANGGRFLISHPATTGSSNGLDWLTKFNASCHKIAPKTGCPLDFISAHWYGNFDGMVAWIDQLDDFYNGNNTNVTDTSLKIWISELSLPQQDADVTVEMINKTLPYLDASDIVDGYAWFGSFRSSNSNDYTGKNVALFKSDGALTELGATYLNGAPGTADSAAFKEGQKGTVKDSAASGNTPAGWGLSMAFGLAYFVCW